MKVNFDFVKWVFVVYVFSFEEYMEVGEVEFIVYVFLVGIFMIKGKIVKEVYEWLKVRLKFF